MVDLDKFICSFISYKADEETMEELREFGADLQTAQAALTVVARSIKKALAEQGFEYKDGKLVGIQEKRTPVTIESPYGKETFYVTDEQKDLFESSCKKPSTIKFEPDIDAMVEEYKKKNFETFDKAHSYYLAFTYKQGLKDMWNKMKKG